MRYADGRWAERRWERKRGRRFSVSGEGSAVNTAIERQFGALWNPHSTRSLFITGILVEMQASANNSLYGRRISARGTPASTVTPDIDNDLEREEAPVTGALLDLGSYSVEPTVVQPSIVVYKAGGVTTAGNSGFIALPDLRIPPGTGFCMGGIGAATNLTAELGFEFWE